MTSETSSSAEQPVFCQHILKPVPNEPGAYRCDRCGQVGDMVDRQIVWREKQQAKARQGRVLAAVLAAACGAVIVASATAATMNWRHADAVQPLEPIPLAEAEDTDGGCCGGGPQESGGCCRYYFIPRAGDVNGDGVVNQQDRTPVCDYTLICLPPRICVVTGFAFVDYGDGTWGTDAFARCMTAAQAAQALGAIVTIVGVR